MRCHVSSGPCRVISWPYHVLLPNVNALNCVVLRYVFCARLTWLALVWFAFGWCGMELLGWDWMGLDWIVSVLFGPNWIGLH